MGYIVALIAHMGYYNTYLFLRAGLQPADRLGVPSLGFFLSP